MEIRTSKRKPAWRLLIIILVILAVLVTAIAVLMIVNGQSLSPKNILSTLYNNARTLIDSPSINSASKGSYTNVIFLHHSTGQNLIAEGAVREEFTRSGITFFDHDYNPIGLREPSGAFKGYNYAVPYDNTDIDGLAAIFKQPEFPLPINTLSALLQHEVIIIKSCFPNSNITSDEALDKIKNVYLGIRATMARHPEKLFIIMTTPPLNPAETNSAIADRARRIASWLVSEEFLKGHRNIAVFDFFNLLAEDNPGSSEYNMLKKIYRNGDDSHPNQKANSIIGPQLVNFVSHTIKNYRNK